MNVGVANRNMNWNLLPTRQTRRGGQTALIQKGERDSFAVGDAPSFGNHTDLHLEAARKVKMEQTEFYLL